MNRVVLVMALTAALLSGAAVPALAGQTQNGGQMGSSSAASEEATIPSWHIEGLYSPKQKCLEKGARYVNLWKASGGTQGYQDFYCSVYSVPLDAWWLYVWV